MADAARTWEQVLGRLQGQGLVTPEAGQAVTDRLAAPAERPHVVIELLVGAGAWAAAVCFVVALDQLDQITLIHWRAWQGYATWGALFLAAGVGLRAATDRTFPAQFALALSFAGHVLLMIAAETRFRGASDAAPAAMTQAVLCAALYRFYRDAIYRIVMPLLAVVMAVVAACAADQPWLLHALVALGVGSTGWLFLRRRVPSTLRPLACVCAASVPCIVLLLGFWRGALWHGMRAPMWPSTVIVAAGLAALILHLGGGATGLKAPGVRLALAATVALAAISNPGILAAIALLALGYALDDEILLGLGALFLPVFIAFYYHALDVSLARKSWVLAGSGCVLLAARWWLRRRPWARETRT